MTEEQWLAATDPTPMLVFVRGMVSDRKLRLFACGCVRHSEDLLFVHLLVSGCHAALDAALRYADGLDPCSQSRM
jgi:hypothetical protein